MDSGEQEDDSHRGKKLKLQTIPPIEARGCVLQAQEKTASEAGIMENVLKVLHFTVSAAIPVEQPSLKILSN